MSYTRLILGLSILAMSGAAQVASQESPPRVPRQRVLVSSDIGGTDPDDLQSMAHFLLYADRFDVEGLVSSPYGPGRKQHILEVIDRVWPYVIRSDFAGLDGLSGRFAAVPPPLDRTRRASSSHPYWWTDDPDPSAAEGIHPGAKSVSRWREAFLGDFAERLLRSKAPKP